MDYFFSSLGLGASSFLASVAGAASALGASSVLAYVAGAASALGAY